ncbi:hypothetical protein ACFVW5_28610 [Streptomyces sp. NPDC058232]|uniref:hypothetical protein n=1 Tax=Streptomyces sp. NPDC058232 TaxID=3346393 RepID=UPI0036EA9F05
MGLRWHRPRHRHPPRPAPHPRPHGPVWWRFGHSDWQPITDALTNPGTEGEYHAREDQQHQERAAQEERRRQEREEELRRREAGKWPCPSCGGPVYPGDA